MRTSRLVIFILTISCSVALSVNVAAAAIDSVAASASHVARQRVLELLQGYEWHLSDYQFETMPPNTYEILMDIVADENLLAFVRRRALLALSHYANETVWLFFIQWMAKDDNLIKPQRVIETMCATFAASKPAQLGQLLLPDLVATDVHYAAAIEKCLQQTNSLSEADVGLALKVYAAGRLESNRQSDVKFGNGYVYSEQLK
ncbi:MAG: hypothetical protein KUG79_09765 [Pseudomonadales bacterium]|nr:hypothetical protein [Pseudomonadales bacterium]